MLMFMATVGAEDGNPQPFGCRNFGGAVLPVRH